MSAPVMFTTTTAGVDIAHARIGRPSIKVTRPFLDGFLTPAEAAELARDLQTAADIAIGLDGTAPEGAPASDDEEEF